MKWGKFGGFTVESATKQGIFKLAPGVPPDLKQAYEQSHADQAQQQKTYTNTNKTEENTKEINDWLKSTMPSNRGRGCN